MVFSRWVNYCFTAGYKEFHGEFSDDRYEVQVEYLNIDPAELAALISHLFESPALIQERFSRDQIADGIWFLFGVASEYFYKVREKSVPAAQQVCCYRALKILYRELFDKICRDANEPGLSMQAINADKLESAIYMIWDMNYVEGAAMSDGWPHLVEPCFEVLQAALDCRSAACKISALHGLGHLARYHPDRVRKMAGKAASNSNLPKWIREYAAAAREGCVQ
ncbi:MAG: hypothetical protein ACKVS9_04540 [Phycisphaerae bacterium]